MSPDFLALLAFLLLVTCLAAVLAVNGNLTVQIRRRPQPRVAKGADRG